MQIYNCPKTYKHTNIQICPKKEEKYTNIAQNTMQGKVGKVACKATNIQIYPPKYIQIEV